LYISIGPSPAAQRTNHLLLLLVLSAMLVLGGCQGALFAGLNATNQHKGTDVQRDIVFDQEHQLSLDIYRPVNAQHAPVVVFFYGGSWVHGKRQWYRFTGAALAARGVIVVIPDYRKYPQVKMDGFMRDAALAVAWTHDHANELGGNPDDLFIMGHSAGGQIAGLLATDPQWLQADGMQPHDLAGFIGLAGVYDFMPIAANETDMLGMFGTTPAQQSRAQPVLFVQGKEPPMLLLHGTADTEVEPANSQSLARVMKAHDEQAILKLYPDVGHSALLFSLSRPLREHAPTLDDILSFIHAHPSSAPGAPVRQKNLTPGY
jgi:acetyl esterase/lipase